MRNTLLLLLLCALLVGQGELTTQDAFADSPDLWVDAVNGKDTNNGLIATTAFRTIQRAADLSSPGTTIHILSGTYRETIRPAQSGTAAAPIRYVAENGRDTVFVRGSTPSSSLTWVQLTSNTIGLPAGVNPASIYYADLSAWALSEPPRFVVQANGSTVTRLPLAREPDEKVTTEWKQAEFWWAADGGWDAAECNPLIDLKCDIDWRSSTRLTDRTNDPEPVGIEAGNLTTLNNLAGGTLVALDNQSGHYVYRRTITAHDRSSGRITVNPPANAESAYRLGWGSKYYIENRPSLLDQPGEWWYDTVTKRLYLWDPIAGNPATHPIEISRRDIGVNLNNRSYIVLDGLNFEFFNASVIEISNDSDQKSYGDTIRRATLRYADCGIEIDQGADGSADSITSGFTLEDSEVAFMDSQALYLNYWWEDGTVETFSHAGIVNTVIRNNNLHHLGFRSDSDNPVGNSFLYADKLRFEDNYVHHIAQNGTQFSYAINHETGDILVKGNVFEYACQLTADCGALKFWGDPPDKNIFRDVFVTANVFRNTFGWTYISEARQLWSVESVWGQGGFGFYTDWVSGLHVYRNIAYNNSFSGFNLYGTWRDDDMFYYNNIAANSLHGFYLGGLTDTTDPTQTAFENNIIINNRAYGITIDDPNDLLSSITTIKIDHNLYYNNGWDSNIYKPGAMIIDRGEVESSYYQTLANIRANTIWEDHGVAGDPVFWDYDLADHNLYDGSWPDFHVISGSSNVVDRGTDTLPLSLTTLLTYFGVEDNLRGQAFDIGRYESGFSVKPTPTFRISDPGRAVKYTLCLIPPDLSYSVQLAIVNPLPANLTVNLDQNVLNLSDCATLVVSNNFSSPPNLRYTIPIIGTGDRAEYATSVDLLVGGSRVYTPLILKGV